METSLKPQETPLFLMRLDWMRDNEPEYLMELYRKGELQKEILSDVNKAYDHYTMLLKKGVDKEVASEIRTSLLAPADGLGMRNVPKIPDKMWEKILLDVTN